MLSRSFCEKLILLLVGSYLSYFVSVEIMKQSGNIEMIDKTIFLKVKQRLGTNIKINSHEETILSNVIFPNDINVSFKDICGYDEVKSKIKQMVLNPLDNKDYYKDDDLLQPPNGLILHGPPGTGKTMFAKAIAKELNGIFINFNISSIENKLYGESSKLLKSLFTLSQKIKPCVIFIDEIDGSFSERNPFDQSFVNNIKTQMLQLMDGIIEKDPSILIIGATNKLNTIDKAMKRRMRLHIEVDLPNDITRQMLFEKFLKRYKFDCKNFVEKSKDLSGSDIFEICKISAHNSILQEKTLDESIILDSLDTFC